jgi:hypothetical protein
VANLLVMMEFYRGALLPLSLEVLGQARRLGSSLGLTVYALVPLPPEPAEDEDITVRCGRFGADKVVLLTGDSLFSEHEMRYQPFADALAAACTLLPPRLLLMGDTPAARDIVPRLAARFGAAHLPGGQVLSVRDQLVLCDATGRQLRLPFESSPSDGSLPLTISVMATLPAGRNDMAWGAQDAELIIVPPNDESAQTIPNLTLSRIIRGGFSEEAIEPLALEQRLAVQAPGGLLPQSAGPADARLALWQVELGAGSTASPASLPIWRLHIGTTAAKRANYQLALSDGELAAAAAQLFSLLSAPGPAATIVNPSQTPPMSPALEGFDVSSEFTPTADDWDFGGETLSGESETTAKIRAVLSERRPARELAPPPPSAPPPQAAPPKPAILTQNPLSGPAAAMWEGFATLPGAGTLPVDGQGNPDYDEAHADTAPVSIASADGVAATKSQGGS